SVCGESEATRASPVRGLARRSYLMTDTAIIERDVVVPAASEAGRTPFSWSATIAGALAAAAVAFIIVALGSGIGLSVASPYGSAPSATSLTIAAAVWLVMAKTRPRAGLSRLKPRSSD